MHDLQTIHLHDFVTHLQPGARGWAVGEDFADNRGLRWLNEDLPQTLPLPGFRGLFDRLYHDFLHLSVALKFDGDLFVLAADNTPLNAIAHAIELLHGL